MTSTGRKLRTDKVAVVAAIVGLILATAFAAYFGSTESQDSQRKLAGISTVWGMHACVVVAAIGLGPLYRRLYTLLGRRRLITALAVGIVGYAICGLAPETNRIYFDEHIYMNIGQSIAHTGRAEAANFSRAEYGEFEMYDGWVNKQPNGFPYVLSWFYKLFGVSEHISHVANRVCIGIAAAALYLGLSFVPWSLPAGAALAAALLFSATPLVIWWGATAAVEPSTAATAAVAFMCACIHARLSSSPNDNEGNVSSAVLLGGTMAFACYFRPESLLIYPVTVVLLWTANRRILFQSSTWLFLAAALTLTLPQLMHIWSMHTENWGATDGRRFDIAFLAPNFKSNAGYFFDSKWFPITGTLLALAGLQWLRLRCAGGAVTVLLWFAMAWGIFVCFYAGGYYYGASSRYGVISAAPVAILMGVGLAAVHAGLKRVPALAFGLGAVAILNWLTAMHYIPSLSRESAEARADIDFIARSAPILPEGSIVLANDPCAWNIYHKNSAQIFTLAPMIRSNLNELRRQYPGGIFLHWNFWHNVEPTAEAEARELVQDTHAEIVTRTQSQSHQLAILRLDTPTAIKKFGGPPAPPREIPNLDDALRAIDSSGNKQ